MPEPKVSQQNFPLPLLAMDRGLMGTLFGLWLQTVMQCLYWLLSGMSSITFFSNFYELWAPLTLTPVLLPCITFGRYLPLPTRKIQSSNHHYFDSVFFFVFFYLLHMKFKKWPFPCCLISPTPRQVPYNQCYSLQLSVGLMLWLICVTSPPFLATTSFLFSGDVFTGTRVEISHDITAKAPPWNCFLIRDLYKLDYLTKKRLRQLSFHADFKEILQYWHQHLVADLALISMKWCSITSVMPCSFVEPHKMLFKIKIISTPSLLVNKAAFFSEMVEWMV